MNQEPVIDSLQHLEEKSVYNMIPYQEVQVQQETQFEEGEQTAANNVDDAQVNGNRSNIVLRKREYRTARHMALIETQI